MNIIISKLVDHCEGWEISLKNDESIETIAIVNGNKPLYSGPIVVLGVDQYILFGLSNPVVVGRILAEGPQEMISSRDLAHKIFEHGMKSVLGRIRINNNYFLTCLETFYTVKSESGLLSLVLGNDGQLGCLIGSKNWNKKILITLQGFTEKADSKSQAEIVYIDQIRSVVTMKI